MKQNETKKMPKNIESFHCVFCKFICSKKSNFNAHLTTRKHKNTVNETNMKQKNAVIEQTVCQACGTQFNSRTTMWRHKKKCKSDACDTEHTETYLYTPPDASAIIELIIQNTDFKELIVEQSKLIQEQSKSIIELSSKPTTTTNNNTINNNNQKFNLNFFLNTTCKDAMNMSEFIESMQINFKDIENIGRNGYVTGMTDMILSRIKELDITKRPVHCTDIKREIIYIKDNDVWEKDANNVKLHKMIGCIAQQNYGIIPAWRDNNPDAMDSETPTFEFCITMMRNILGDTGEEQIRLDNKVIKNITKHIVVNKN